MSVFMLSLINQKSNYSLPQERTLMFFHRDVSYGEMNAIIEYLKK
jgi:hypothetical protein